MSTLKVSSIQNPSTSSGGVSIDISGHVTVDGVAMPSSGPLSNRNLIINGAMQVAQRGTQVTGVTTQAYYTCDQFQLNVSTLGTWTVDQDTNAPNGFSNSFKLTCTTADASPAAGDYLIFQHKIEAQNLQSLGFGTANAQATILSFWVRSNKTGNASIAVRQSDNSGKHVSFQYSVSSADTWEYKTIAIPADTSGVIDNDNGEGLKIEWWLNSGSNYTGGSHQSAWITPTNTDRNASNFGLGGATSDYFAITGVQLEVGSVATPFEHRSYGQELALCQRYYYKIHPGQYDTFCLGYNRNTTLCQAFASFPVTMRAAPTALETSGTASDYRVVYLTTGATCNAVPFFDHASSAGSDIYFQIASGLTAGQGSKANSNAADAYLAWSAEL